MLRRNYSYPRQSITIDGREYYLSEGYSLWYWDNGSGQRIVNYQRAVKLLERKNTPLSRHWLSLLNHREQRRQRVGDAIQRHKNYLRPRQGRTEVSQWDEFNLVERP